MTSPPTQLHLAKSIGGVPLESPLGLAPLAGWTTLAYRESVRALGGVGFAITEVLSAPAIIGGGRRSEEYLATSDADRPLGVQLNAGSPEEARKAALVVAERGYAFVDFNLGCPVKKITRKGRGAALTRDIEATTTVIAAAVEALAPHGVPVTAKMRLGWESVDGSAPLISAALEQVGVVAISVHGRTRAQAFTGDVSWGGIRDVVSAVSVPVFANGDVLTVDGAVEMLRYTGAAGLLIGRGGIENPWLFDAVARRLAGQPDPPAPTWSERVAFVRRHFRRSCELRGPARAVRPFRKVLLTFCKASGAGKTMADRGVRLLEPDEVEAFLDDLLALEPVLAPPPPGGHVKAPKTAVNHW